MKIDYQYWLGRINESISQQQYGQHPTELYEPLRYIMQLGGKRMRPFLTLLGYSLYRDALDQALQPAIGVEVFHNFTLMHDDIMDNAPLRRNQPTVHEKWNSNIAILSGDVMLVKAYQQLAAVPPNCLPGVLQYFNQCAIGVCEGQQIDMNFEHRTEVTIAEYLEMIKLKTAVLLGFSLRLGGILAEAPQQQCDMLDQFGIHLGLGFQLKDDLLDVYGDAAKVGKQVAGDIIANKKTFLLITALQQASPAQRQTLNHWLGLTTFNSQEKVQAVKQVYDQLQIQQQTQQEVNTHFNKALAYLEQLPVSAERKAPVKAFIQLLIDRDS